MNENQKACCFTGYRPGKFPFPMSRNSKAYIEFENKLFDVITGLPDKEGCYTFYSGMAMGFDIIAAEIVLMLKKAYKKAKIKLVCVLPFKTQAAKYYPEWKKRYDKILKAADEIICLSENYYNASYQVRNEYMVDRSDIVVTWFDGQTGGTKNTLNYAERKGKQIINVRKNEEKQYSFNIYEISK